MLSSACCAPVPGTQHRLYWPEGAPSRESERAVRKMKTLESIIQDAGELGPLQALHAPLIELLRGLLRYEPGERLTAKEALQHSFFTAATAELIHEVGLSGASSEPGAVAAPAP